MMSGDSSDDSFESAEEGLPEDAIPLSMKNETGSSQQREESHVTIDSAAVTFSNTNRNLIGALDTLDPDAFAPTVKSDQSFASQHSHTFNEEAQSKVSEISPNSPETLQLVTPNMSNTNWDSIRAGENISDLGRSLSDIKFDQSLEWKNLLHLDEKEISLDSQGRFEVNTESERTPVSNFGVDMLSAKTGDTAHPALFDFNLSQSVPNVGETGLFYLENRAVIHSSSKSSDVDIPSHSENTPRIQTSLFGDNKCDIFSLTKSSHSVDPDMKSHFPSSLLIPDPVCQPEYHSNSNEKVLSKLDPSSASRVASFQLNSENASFHEPYSQRPGNSGTVSLSPPPSKTVVNEIESNEISDGWEVGDWDLVEMEIKDLAEVPSLDQTEKLPTPAISDPLNVEALLSECANEDEFSPETDDLDSLSWVKNVGSGLVSNLVESFSHANLPTPFSFSEKVATSQDDGVSEELRNHISRSDELQAQNAKSQHAVGGWKWGIDFGSLAKSISSTVETKGMQFIQGGVDVLEVIGQKTFTALKQTDPGLEYTKRFLRAPEMSEMPKLSQLIREASQQYQTTVMSSEQSRAELLEARKGDFGFQLELRHALVHMEALELLSSRASSRLRAKLTRLSSRSRTDDPDRMALCSLTNDDSVLDNIWQTLNSLAAESEDMSAVLLRLNPICPGTALENTYSQLHESCLGVSALTSTSDTFNAAVGALAESTSAVLAYLHKLSEFLLARPDRVRNGFLDVAQNIDILINSIRASNDRLCSKYVDRLKQLSGEEASTPAAMRLVANLFLELGTANNYFGEAACCLTPIVQLACVDAFFPDDLERSGI